MSTAYRGSDCVCGQELLLIPAGMLAAGTAGAVLGTVATISLAAAE